MCFVDLRQQMLNFVYFFKDKYSFYLIVNNGIGILLFKYIHFLMNDEIVNQWF